MLKPPLWRFCIFWRGICVETIPPTGEVDRLSNNHQQFDKIALLNSEFSISKSCLITCTAVSSKRQTAIAASLLRRRAATPQNHRAQVPFGKPAARWHARAPTSDDTARYCCTVRQSPLLFTSHIAAARLVFRSLAMLSFPLYNQYR